MKQRSRGSGGFECTKLAGGDDGDGNAAAAAAAHAAEGQKRAHRVGGTADGDAWGAACDGTRSVDG